MDEHTHTFPDGPEGTPQGTSEQEREEESKAVHDETVLAKRSQRKIEANRRNAQKSTGPKTSRGKAAVRFNALKHGLLAEQILLAASEEERGSVEQVLRGLYEHFQPVGYLEAHCVEELAVCLLKKRRALRWEIFQQRQAPPFFAFGYAAHLVSAKTKLARMLGVRQLNEPKVIEPHKSELARESPGENQSAPPTSVPGEPIPAGDVLITIVRYESANDRKFHRMILYLERLQRERKGEKLPAPISVSVDI